MGSSSFALKLQTPETAHSEGTETEGKSGRWDFPKSYIQQTASKTFCVFLELKYYVYLLWKHHNISPLSKFFLASWNSIYRFILLNLRIGYIFYSIACWWPLPCCWSLGGYCSYSAHVSYRMPQLTLGINLRWAQQRLSHRHKQGRHHPSENKCALSSLRTQHRVVRMCHPSTRHLGTAFFWHTMVCIAWEDCNCNNGDKTGHYPCGK